MLFRSKKIVVEINYISQKNNQDICFSLGIFDIRINSFIAYGHNDLYSSFFKTKKKGVIRIETQIPYVRNGKYKLITQCWLDTKQVIDSTIIGEIFINSHNSIIKESINNFPAVLVNNMKWFTD